MSSDFEELLRSFNGNSLKYLIVGGHALMLYSGRADLVKNKRASGRHIDLHDAELLE